MRIYSPLIAQIKVTKKATTTVSEAITKRPKIIFNPIDKLNGITIIDSNM